MAPEILKISGIKKLEIICPVSLLCPQMYEETGLFSGILKHFITCKPKILILALYDK